MGSWHTLHQAGPHAAACAYKLPNRVTAAALVSCPVPGDVPGVAEGLDKQHRLFLSLVKRPWLMRAMLWWMVKTAPSDPAKALKGALANQPPHDAALLRMDGFFEVFWNDSEECFRQGVRGCAHDLALAMGAWGFDPAGITVPVSVWQGKLDQSVPRAAGEYLARTIPGCQATFLPGEGHLGGFHHWEAILRSL